jgi:choline dehydrogenase-like flavoprotein
MTYTRTEDVQINAWGQELGNKGWSWSSLLPYYKKSEHFQKPTAAQVAAGASYNVASTGFGGPVKVGWNTGFSNSSISDLLGTASQHLGVGRNADASDGHMRGYNVWPKTVDVKSNIRADAARSYYWPYEKRRNLVVLSKTLAHKIIWHNDEDQGPLRAIGVEVTSAGAPRRYIKARQEVIVSAGSLKSPLLLELSGIGNPKILSRYNIPVRVALPGVGELLQDQTNAVIANKLKGLSVTGYPQYVSYISASDIFGKSTGAAASSLQASLPKYASAVARASNGAVNASALEKQYKVLHKLLFQKNVPIAEILHAPGGSTMVTPFWPTMPFARGSVHITANNISAPAVINPNYFMCDFDVQVQGAIGNYIRRLHATSPMKEHVGAEQQPGYSSVPRDSDEAGWATWLKSNYGPNNHPISTAAMLPRELGGVVDAGLKIYGTSNVRVVDASVLPQQLVGHLSSTLYAIAERASDAIKEDLNKA